MGSPTRFIAKARGVVVATGGVVVTAVPALADCIST